MITISQKVLNDLVEERNKQHAKFDEQNHSDEWWKIILGEESGEIDEAILHDHFGGPAAGTVRTELVQLVAVGIAWLEAIDRRDQAERDRQVDPTRPHVADFAPIDETSPSGKQLFQCRVCGRKSATPDKGCFTLGMAMEQAARGDR